MSTKRSIFNSTFLAPLQEWLRDSRAVGIILLACTILSLIISNTAAGPAYMAFWEAQIHFPVIAEHIPHSLLHGINDGLMAVFFLLAGMEIKREVLTGELSGLKKAILPVMAALGGMVLPALLYYSWNIHSGFAQGWGIPMATDIAFSLGILSLLGNKVPPSLKILLTALAIMDDLGAIITIAVFYTDQINMMFLGFAGLIWLILLVMNKAKVSSLLPYFLLGAALWYCLFHSGVHATLAGVLLAFALPSNKINAIEHKLHLPVSFIVLPLFALANTAIRFPAEIHTALSSPVNYGILTGLIAGKPLGITLVSYVAVKLKLARLPDDLNWRSVFGMGLLAGIGFTMSIFIAMLAFDDSAAQITAKLSVLIASLIAGIAGFIFLNVQRPAAQPSNTST